MNAFERAYKKEAIRIAAKYCKQQTQDASAEKPVVPKALQIALAKAEAKLQLQLGKKPREVSKWFCKKLLGEISASQKRALARAGISTGWLKKHWTVPVIRGQYVSKAAAEKIPDYVEWSTSLITRMCENSARKVQNAIAEGISKGYDLSKLTTKINALENMDDARAARVALDQSCKLNQFVQVENAKAIGVTEGVWVHVPGQFESRIAHMKMNGKRFNLKKGMYDPEVDKIIQPGELPFCRCCFKAVLPGYLLGDA